VAVEKIGDKEKKMIADAQAKDLAEKAAAAAASAKGAEKK
jgi:hypothetical protein